MVETICPPIWSCRTKALVNISDTKKALCSTYSKSLQFVFWTSKFKFELLCKCHGWLMKVKKVKKIFTFPWIYKSECGVLKYPGRHHMTAFHTHIVPMLTNVHNYPSCPHNFLLKHPVLDFCAFLTCVVVFLLGNLQCLKNNCPPKKENRIELTLKSF